MPAPYDAPPIPHSSRDEIRRVGLEIELAGLSVAELASAVASALGGTVQDAGDDAHLFAEMDSAFGTFRVELDSAPLQERAYLRPLEDAGLTDRAVSDIERSVLAVATEFVPLELVAPPIPWTRLRELDPLWDAMRAHGGLGTRAAMRYAFGLHINPEVPSPMDAPCILAHLQSFFLLEDWLKREENVDWTRRVVPYIDPFPEEYRQACLAPDYRPGLEGLIDDYLRFSPTRNRVLDLLPLFEHLRPGCTKRDDVEGAELIKPRPTFHYRLPNSDLDDALWSPARAWNNWLEVERLAVDDERRGLMAHSYRDRTKLPFRLQKYGWLDDVDTRWMVRRS